MSMNNLSISGNLTRDPVFRTVQVRNRDGVMVDTAVCNFTVAVNDNRQRRGADGRPIAQFFRVTQWRAAAEACNQYLKKGSFVEVSGAVCLAETESEGVKYHNMELDNAIVYFTPQNAARSNNQNAAVNAPTQNQARPAAASTQAQMPQYDAPVDTGYTEVNEDELPF